MCYENTDAGTWISGPVIMPDPHGVRWEHGSGDMNHCNRDYAGPARCAMRTRMREHESVDPWLCRTRTVCYENTDAGTWISGPVIMPDPHGVLWKHGCGDMNQWTRDYAGPARCAMKTRMRGHESVDPWLCRTHTVCYENTDAETWISGPVIMPDPHGVLWEHGCGDMNHCPWLSRTCTVCDASTDAETCTVLVRFVVTVHVDTMPWYSRVRTVCDARTYADMSTVRIRFGLTMKESNERINDTESEEMAAYHEHIVEENGSKWCSHVIVNVCDSQTTPAITTKYILIWLVKTGVITTQSDFGAPFQHHAMHNLGDKGSYQPFCGRYDPLRSKWPYQDALHFQ